ncbi:MAG: VCBS repeat-containing protein [Thermoplasmata archaeon]|nr:MAG: VCBS repeat-containing protein [Thermoplasmata archaeon]
MNFGVGTRSGAARKLTLLFAILLIFTALDIFSLDVRDEKGGEAEMESDEPMDDVSSITKRDTRGATPIWTNLSGALPSANDYYGIDFGDVNNDGKLDIVAAKGGGAMPADGIHCWLGDGNGGWIENSSGLPTTNWYTDVELADINNDGKLDIACDGGIWTGNGGQGGTMDWTLQVSPEPWRGVALGDMDNNGTIDIATGTDFGVKVWASNGGKGGVFEWTNSSESLPTADQYFGVFFGDVNNDGMLDLAAGSNSNQGVKVWTGNGESGSSALWTDASGTGLPSSGNFAQVCFGDANSDGKLDLAAASQTQGVKFWKGNGGAGGFLWTEESAGLATTGRFLGLGFADINSDGKLDLVGANKSGGGIRVWLGDGGEGGSMDWTYASEGLPGSINGIDVCLGDVNNDGRMDIGATTEFNGVQVWTGNRPDISITGWISASTNLPASTGWHDVVFGDVNHDGKLDLAATSNGNEGVKVWLGNGSGDWTEVVGTDLPTSGYYNGVRLVDINHDGDLDVIAVKDDASGLYVWLGNGSGGFGPDTGPGGSTAMGGVEWADINNDGNLDLASGRYNPNDMGVDDKVYVWLGDGNGGWSGDIGPIEDLGYDDVAFGDVDHNGTVDLFATGHMQGYRFWLGDGTGGWSMPPRNGLPNSSSGLGACFGDVNHDGHLDIAIASWVPGNSGIRVFTSNGAENGSVWWTEESGTLPTSEVYGGMELGDINCDGHLDILTTAAWSNGNGIALYLGNGGEGGSMIWTDTRLPNLPFTGDYWGVAYGDVNNDGVLDIAITSDTNGVEVYITQTQFAYKMDLEEGWNLISLPLIQPETSVETVFDSISGDYSDIRCYDSFDASDPWKHFAPKKPLSQIDLADVYHTTGIWIRVTKPGGTTLTVIGSELITEQPIVLRPGWNLVGYPSRIDRTRDAALGNLVFDTDVDSIWTFNAATKEWEEIGPSDSFQVGRGYWIHSMKDTDIILNVPN